MIKLIYDGLSIDGDKVVYNSNSDSDSDIMNTIEPEIYKSEFGGNVYYFGYAFKDSTSRKDRTTIIRWIKGLGQDVADSSSVKNMIDKALLYFDKNVNISDISCIVYTRSGRSSLTNTIIRELGNFSQRDTIKTAIEDERSKEVIKSIQSGKILIVDDINTSGSTLNEIIRIIRKINNQCEIYIFTLIGKE